jgi:hypothetical protein
MRSGMYNTQFGRTSLTTKANCQWLAGHNCKGACNLGHCVHQLYPCFLLSLLIDPSTTYGTYATDEVDQHHDGA